jgi:isocitrate/isopropylmalate dehydrogenase
VKLLVLPGDGVGVEVTEAAVRVREWFFEMQQRDFGLVNWQKHGTKMPGETWARIWEADAILFGAVGRAHGGHRGPGARPCSAPRG